MINKFHAENASNLELFPAIWVPSILKENTEKKQLTYNFTQSVLLNNLIIKLELQVYSQ